jgi:hypothetical protein
VYRSENRLKIAEFPLRHDSGKTPPLSHYTAPLYEVLYWIYRAYFEEEAQGGSREAEFPGVYLPAARTPPSPQTQASEQAHDTPENMLLLTSYSLVRAISTVPPLPAKLQRSKAQ